jgi:NitT/TauT family transport system substrate-binding protein
MLMIIAAVILVIAIVLSSFVYLNSQVNSPNKIDSITIGNAQSFECDTLVYTAQQQNYFLQNGLNVTIMNYTSGMAAVNDVLNGKLDIAATAEFPLVTNSLKGQNISALACIGKFQLQDLIARKDHGIQNVSDLKGKTIGVPLGTISEFYLGRFLELNDLSFQNVTIVNITPTGAMNAIVSGTVDAVVIWQPYAYAIEEQLGSNAVFWSPQSSQATYILEVANNNWIKENPEIANHFINALAQAESYYINNPSKTETMIQKGLNYTDGYMASVWHNQQISLSLDQSLILALDDEAQWLINNNLTNATALPNFLNYVYLKSLESAKPNAVAIVH